MAGVRAVSVLESTNVTLVAATPPILMVAPFSKLLPVTVIRVPPGVGPLRGDTGPRRRPRRGRRRVGEGPRACRRLAVRVGDLDVARAGGAGRRRAVICVALEKTTLVAATPATRTVAPETKFEPVSVMVVPPLVGPEVGETDVNVGVVGVAA